MLTLDEVAQHASRQSCWVIIKQCVYDVTEFLDEHPGGANIILRYAGKDVTEEYTPVHPPGTLEKELPKEKHLGPVQKGTSRPQPSHAASHGQSSGRPLMLCLNSDDFEKNAQLVASQRAWTYYSSAADDLVTHHSNLHVWPRIRFRPRMLRNVQHVRMRQTMLGSDFALPFFIAPVALARLGHPEGELCLARGAAKWQIPYAVSSGASLSIQAIMQTARDNVGQAGMWFQLYVRKRRKENLAIIREARQLGYRALLITVDTPVVGKREDDDRQKAQAAYDAGETTAPVIGGAQASGDSGFVFRGPYSSTLDWDDLQWIREVWGDQGPICLKGILTPEDAKTASLAGIEHIYLSNHGGRQLDGSPSALHTLLEIRRFYPEVLEQCEVLIDGGVRRGQDAVKALCLGARGVGLGRPFMYALTGYGTDGVVKLLQILSEELQTAMRLLGVTALDQLRPYMVNCGTIEQELSTLVEPSHVQNAKL